MENENKIFNQIPEVIHLPEDFIIVSGDTDENKIDISELPPPPPQISIFD